MMSSMLELTVQQWMWQAGDGPGGLPPSDFPQPHEQPWPGPNEDDLPHDECEDGDLICEGEKFYNDVNGDDDSFCFDSPTVADKATCFNPGGVGGYYPQDAGS